MTDRDAFGQTIEEGPWDPSEGDPLLDGLDQQTEAEATPDPVEMGKTEVTEAEPAEQPQPVQDELVVEEEETGTPEETEEPAEPSEPETKLYAGKYRTPEELEEAHRHLDGWATRVHQQSLNAQQELERAIKERDELKQGLERVAPLLQQVQQQQQQVPQILQQQMREAWENQDFEKFSQLQQQFIQTQVNQGVNQGLQQHLTPLQQQMEQRQQQALNEQVVAQRRATIQSFREQHPDVTPGSPVEAEIYRLITDYRTDESGKMDENRFPLTQENLHLAYEVASDPQVRTTADRLRFEVSDSNDVQLMKDAAANPALFEVLAANPQYLESDAGHRYARKQAGLPEAIQTAQQQAQAQKQEQVAAQRNAAFVERGSTAAPVQGAPGARPKDVFDEVLERQQTRNSIFGN